MAAEARICEAVAALKAGGRDAVGSDTVASALKRGNVAAVYPRIVRQPICPRVTGEAMGRGTISRDTVSIGEVAGACIPRHVCSSVEAACEMSMISAEAVSGEMRSAKAAYPPKMREAAGVPEAADVPEAAEVAAAAEVSAPAKVAAAPAEVSATAPCEASIRSED